MVVSVDLGPTHRVVLVAGLVPVLGAGPIPDPDLEVGRLVTGDENHQGRW